MAKALAFKTKNEIIVAIQPVNDAVHLTALDMKSAEVLHASMMTKDEFFDGVCEMLGHKFVADKARGFYQEVSE